MDFPRATGPYGFLSLTKKQKVWGIQLHVQKTAAWTIPKTRPIYQLGQHTRTPFPTNIKIMGGKLAQSLVCCPIWQQHQEGNTDHQTPFILTALYIGIHVAILAAQFLFFFKFVRYPLVLYSFCNMREYQKIRSSAVTLGKKYSVCSKRGFISEQ